MPVHLFGRPAPLEELAELGVPLVEDAAQAFGAKGTGRTGVASTYSFFPTKNLFALRRRRPRLDGRRRARGARAAAALPRLEGERRSSSSSATTRAWTRSRPPSLRVFLPHLEEWNRSRREAAARYAELGLGEVVRAAGRRAGSRVPPLRRPFARARPDRRAPRRRRDRLGAYYVTPLHLQPALALPRLGRDGLLPETERAGAREPRASDVGRHRRRAQERIVAAVREGGHRWRPSDEQPGQPPSGLAARRRRRADRRRLVPRVPASLRLARKIPPFYEKLVSWRTILLVVAIKLVVFTALRLLQPLVALCVHAGHVGRAPRGDRRLARRRASSSISSRR